jgi:hypothetical protein
MLAQWWAFLLLSLVPLIVLKWLLPDGVFDLSSLHMPLFVAGLCSLFVSLPLFSRFKHALITTQSAMNTENQAAAWADLARVRQHALFGAGLPAWIAALAVLVGLHLVALILLALCTVLIFWLYRIPPQLG